MASLPAWDTEVCKQRRGAKQECAFLALSSPIVKVVWPAAFITATMGSHHHGLNPQTVSHNKPFLMLLLSEHFFFFITVTGKEMETELVLRNGAIAVLILGAGSCLEMLSSAA